MASDTAHVWIRSADGELVRSDAITWLRWRSGQVETARPDGTVVQLAGPGCPPAFHDALLGELESHWRWPDARWVVITTAEVSADGARWVSARLDEPAEISVRDG
jgi:hypothetical protein